MRTSGCDRHALAVDAGAIDDEWLARPAAAAIASLRVVQESALAIYGRLEPDRALVWTLEELGELAQAVRRGEGNARLAEELGQLGAWMFCLANILGVDLATAVESAMREEIGRQLAKYGQLRPYEPDRRAGD